MQKMWIIFCGRLLINTFFLANCITLMICNIIKYSSNRCNFKMALQEIAKEDTQRST